MEHVQRNLRSLQEVLNFRVVDHEVYITWVLALEVFNRLGSGDLDCIEQLGV